MTNLSLETFFQDFNFFKGDVFNSSHTLGKSGSGLEFGSYKK